MFISYQLKLRKDNRTFGKIFYACCDEIKDISFVEALQRVLILAVDKIRQAGSFCEKTAHAFLDAVIETALINAELTKCWAGS